MYSKNILGCESHLNFQTVSNADDVLSVIIDFRAAVFVFLHKPSCLPFFTVKTRAAFKTLVIQAASLVSCASVFIANGRAYGAVGKVWYCVRSLIL